MSHLSWLEPHIEYLLRILLGTGLGAAIGFERDLHGRPAGLRTHAIVALGAATFMVVSTRFVFFQHYAAGDLVEVDASRIAASVVSGIGFLGAGAILRTGITIRGLTTAAALWLVAAIGMAAGAGMYVIAVFTTLVGLASLTLLRRFEDRGEPVARQRVTILLDESRVGAPAVIAALTRPGVKVSQEEYDRDETRTRVVFEVRASTQVEGDAIARGLDGVEGIKQIRIERL
ncbi:MAG TPA: MgtC/SapB family protein [Polyangia bacterium]|nr:MgtC/SapB family protein [Polyangia bacterium]